jgi:prepilin peptidase CpaA
LPTAHYPQKRGKFLAANILTIILVMLCAIWDLRESRIPNFFTFPFALIGVAFHGSTNGLDGAFFSIAGLLAGAALLAAPYLLSGMGAGDVKLMGAVGSLLGAKATFNAFIFIALAGGMYAMAIVLMNRKAFRGFFHDKLHALLNMVLLKRYVPIHSANSQQRPRLKYGVAIAVGTMTFLVAQPYGFTLFK